MDRTMYLQFSPREKDKNSSSVVVSLCSPPNLHCPPSCSTNSSDSSTSLTPTVEFVASKQCQALILSPIRVANILAERKRLYRRTKRQLVCEGTPTQFKKLDINGNIPLGEGGFGAVFRSSYNNHEVAIKQLYQKRHSPSSDFVSLCAELNAFRLPPSPYVVPILSFTSSGISIQIVSELVHGRDLRKMIEDEEWTPSPMDRFRIAFQVISALWHCHSNMVLHLDVKAANVVVSDDGMVCRLSDFGCSKTASLSENGVLVANAANSCENFGTVAYKAPELLKGGRATDRADIYSYGMLLWELYARRAPFEGIHPHTIIFLVVSRHLRPDLSELGKQMECDSANVQLIADCWAADLTMRPSACELVNKLRSYAYSRVTR
uniref:non-specific serine/threonine protein kinase n=1 Tax=Ascaris suum TaxID=6253 RepID=F1KZ82_ASCSU